MDNNIYSKVDEYITQTCIQESDILKGIQKNNIAKGLPEIHVSPVQGKLLHVLAKSCGAKKILEIGTLGGYSTIWLATALPEDGHLITIEADKGYAHIACSNFKNAGLQKVIELKEGNAIEILPDLVSEAPFDMVFIDADKPPYKEYFDWAVKLSRGGSIIVADNVIREGNVLDENSTDEKVKGVQRLIASLQDNKLVTATIIQTVGTKEHDGMVIAVVN